MLGFKVVLRSDSFGFSTQDFLEFFVKVFCGFSMWVFWWGLFVCVVLFVDQLCLKKVSNESSQSLVRSVSLCLWSTSVLGQCLCCGLFISLVSFYVLHHFQAK